jgi:uroporphyrinogen-III decarboxylase
LTQNKDRLTGKERLTRIFNHQDIDRIPIWMLFPLKPWRLAVNTHDIPSYAEVNRIAMEKTDIIHRMNFLNLPLSNAHPDVVYTQHEKGRAIQYKDKKLQSEIKMVDGKVVKIPLVKSIDDLDFLIEIPFKLNVPDISSYEDDMALLGDRGIPSIMISDPISVLKHLTDETEFPMLLYEEQERVTVFFDEIQRRTIEYCRFFLEKDLGDIYWLDGSEYIAPPFMAPSFFEKWEVKYLSELVKLVRGYGKKSMIHCHGKIGKILPHFKTIGMESLHPLEAPPMGDTSLRNARAILGPDTIFVGNVQYGDLFFGYTEDQIEAMALDIIEESRKGPIIMAITGSPSVDPLPPQAARNHLRLIETCLTKGFY